MAEPQEMRTALARTHLLTGALYLTAGLAGYVGFGEAVAESAYGEEDMFIWAVNVFNLGVNFRCYQ